VHVHQHCIRSQQSPHSGFHYSWIQAKPVRVASFKMLTKFDSSTPAWIILLLETIFIIMLKSYTLDPYGRGHWDNGSIKRLYDMLSSSFGCPTTLQGLNRALPIRQGLRSFGPKICGKCKSTKGPWTWQSGTIYGSVRWCRKCDTASRPFKCKDCPKAFAYMTGLTRHREKKRESLLLLSKSTDHIDTRDKSGKG
jgi:hypothetical protein